MSKNIAIAYTMKKKRKSEGGDSLRGAEQAIHLDDKRGYGNQKEMGVHAASYSHGNDRGASQAGERVRTAPYHKGKEAMADAKEQHKEKLSELKSMKGPHGNYAEGGEVACPTCGSASKGADAESNDFDYVEKDDLVSRAMARKNKR